jgi:muramidase (phage lysozyme)
MESTSSMTIEKALFKTLGLIALLPCGVQATTVEWSSTNHQNHYADINGDGLADLFAVYPADSVAIVYAGTTKGIASTGITYAVADLTKSSRFGQYA